MNYYEYFRDDKSMNEIDWFMHDLTYPLHFHNSIEIIACVDNVCDVTVQDVPVRLRPNDAILIHPGSAHVIDDKGGNICLILSSKYIGKYLDYTSDKRPVYGCAVRNDPDLVSDILNFKKRTAGELNVSIMGYINYILGKFIARMDFVPIDKSENTGVLQNIITYVLANFRKRITLDTVANDLSYNKYYISEVINKNLKCNFTSYVNRIRLECFLNDYDSSRTVEEQLYECGFSSKQTFYRAYKSLYGKNPSLSVKWDPFAR